MILEELNKLRASIRQALHSASKPVGTKTETTSAHISRNLRDLAEAAKHFHATASSTAGSARSVSSQETQQQHSQLAANVSTLGYFPVCTRQRVEQFVQNLPSRVQEPISRQSTPPAMKLRWLPPHIRRRGTGGSVDSSHRSPSSDGLGEEHEDRDLEEAMFDGLRDVALSSIKSMDYNKAIEYLQAAVTQGENLNRSDGESRNLQLQIILCHFLQGKWQLSEPMIEELAKSESELDMVTCNLMHALALVYLRQYKLDQALSICKRARNGKAMLYKRNPAYLDECRQTLGLLTTIHKVRGDYLEAEIFRSRLLPADFEYEHPRDEVAYIQAHTSMLKDVFGEDVQVFWSHGPPTGVAELDGSDNLTMPYGYHTRNVDMLHNNLRSKITGYERYEIDTAKEVVFIEPESPNDADDEASPIAITQGSPIRRHFSRFFGSKRQKPHAIKYLTSYNNQPVSPLEDDSASTSSPSGFRRLKWSLGLQNRKTKFPRRRFQPLNTRLPSRTEDDAEEGGGTFRLLRMERVTTPGRSELTRRFSFSSERCQPYTGSQDVSVRQDVLHFVDSGETESRHLNTESRNERGQSTQEVVSQEERFDHTTDNETPLCELSNTFLTLEELEKRARQIEMARLRRRAVSSRGSPYGLCGFSSSPQHFCFELNVVAANAYLDTLMLDDSVNDSPNHNNTGLDSVDDGAAVRSDFEMETPSHHQKTMGASGSNHVDNEKVFSQLSMIMVSLGGLDNPRDLRAKQLKLRALLPRLKAISHDTTLLGDTERIIQSLGERIKDSQSRHDDSGYESMSKSDIEKELESIPVCSSPEELMPVITCRTSSNRDPDPESIASPLHRSPAIRKRNLLVTPHTSKPHGAISLEILTRSPDLMSHTDDSYSAIELPDKIDQSGNIKSPVPTQLDLETRPLSLEICHQAPLAMEKQYPISASKPDVSRIDPLLSPGWDRRQMVGTSIRRKG